MFVLRGAAITDQQNSSDSVILPWAPTDLNDFVIVLVGADAPTTTWSGRDVGWQLAGPWSFPFQDVSGVNIGTRLLNWNLFYARASDIVPAIPDQVELRANGVSSGATLKISAIMLFFENNWADISLVTSSQDTGVFNEDYVTVLSFPSIPTQEYVQFEALMRFLDDYQPGFLLSIPTMTLENDQAVSIGSGGSFDASMGLTFKTLAANTPTPIAQMGMTRVARRVSASSILFTPSGAPPVPALPTIYKYVNGYPESGPLTPLNEIGDPNAVS